MFNVILAFSIRKMCSLSLKIDRYGNKYAQKKEAENHGGGATYTKSDFHMYLHPPQRRSIINVIPFLPPHKVQLFFQSYHSRMFINHP